MKKILFGLLLAFVSLGIVKNTYAVSDLTFTIDSSNSSSALVLCDSDCSDYSFISVSFNYPSNWSHSTYSSFSIRFTYSNSFTSNVAFPFAFLPGPFSIDFSSSFYSVSSISYISTSNASTFYSDGGSVVITLSEDSPSGGGSTPAPEPEPCPDPEENSQYMNVVLDSFWKYHAAFGGAVVAIIVIFFVYRLIKGVMR